MIPIFPVLCKVLSLFNVLLYIVLCLIWGSTWLAIKIGLESMPPFTSALLRFIIAFVALAAVFKLWRFRFPDVKNVRRNVFLVGTVVYGICYSLTYWGQNRIPSSTASILFSSMPIFTSIFAHFMLQNEKLTLKKVSGLVIGFCGIVTLLSKGLEFSGSLLGMLALVGSAFFSAWSTVKTKRDLGAVSARTLTPLMIPPGILILAISSLILEFPPDIRFDAKAIGSLLFLAFFGTGLAFVGYYYLLKRFASVVMSLIAFVTPLIATLLGAIVLSEELSFRFVVGGVMILSGVLIVTFRRGIARKA